MSVFANKCLDNFGARDGFPLERKGNSVCVCMCVCVCVCVFATPITCVPRVACWLGVHEVISIYAVHVVLSV